MRFIPYIKALKRDRALILAVTITTGCVVKSETTPNTANKNPALDSQILQKLEELEQKQVFLKTSEAGSQPLHRTIHWDKYRNEINPKNEKVHIFGLSYTDVYFPINIEAPTKADIPFIYERIKEQVVTELLIIETQTGNLDVFILKIVPAVEYNNPNFNRDDFGYLKVSKDFTGTYNWFDWDENALHGLRFTDGKVSHKIRFNVSANKPREHD